jgi:hypothetical protein
LKSSDMVKRVNGEVSARRNDGSRHRRNGALPRSCASCRRSAATPCCFNRCVEGSFFHSVLPTSLHFRSHVCNPLTSLRFEV